MDLTGKGSPYIGEVLDHTFEAAQAVVVLLTPDEITYLRAEYALRTSLMPNPPDRHARTSCSRLAWLWGGILIEQFSLNSGRSDRSPTSRADMLFGLGMMRQVVRS